MNVAGVGSFLFLVSMIAMVFWIVALVDALRRPASEWEAAQQNQLVWVVVIVITNIIGAIIYWAVARPQLASVRS